MDHDGLYPLPPIYTGIPVVFIQGNYNNGFIDFFTNNLVESPKLVSETFNTNSNYTSIVQGNIDQVEGAPVTYYFAGDSFYCGEKNARDFKYILVVGSATPLNLPKLTRNGNEFSYSNHDVGYTDYCVGN